MKTQFLALTLIGIVACGGGDGADTPDADGNNPERTLDTCETGIAADAPDFFKTYFRCVDVSVNATGVVINTRNLPPHRSYYYGSGDPNYTAFDFRDDNRYSPNPNRIAAQNISFQIPAEPTPKGITIDAALVDRQAGTSNEEYRGGAVGVALDSVALFNSSAAPGDNIDDEKYTFDSYEAHPEMRGTYHYHSATPGPFEVLQALGLVTTTTPGAAEIELYGIMCDGTVVLGCTELDGATPSDADFDAQNGHVHDIADKDGNTLFTGRYHTHVCPARYTAHQYTPEIQYYDTCN